MKKILLSIATIALVAAVAVKATGAFFTDTVTNKSNTFTTGTLTLQLSGKDSNGSTVSSPFFNVTGMVPGDTKTAFVEIKNTGNIGMYFRTYIEGQTDPYYLGDQLKLSVVLNPLIYTQVLSGFLYGPSNWPIVSDVALSSIEGAAHSLNNNSAVDPLAPGFVAIYKVSVTLPTGVDSGYAGKTFTGNLRVDATQSDNNPGPTPTY